MIPLFSATRDEGWWKSVKQWLNYRKGYTKMRLFKRLLSRRVIAFLGLLALGIPLLVILVIPGLFPYPKERLKESQRGGSLCLLDQEGELLAWRVDQEGQWRLPVKIEEVSPWVIKATIAAEDQRFWSHRGVDFAAALRALLQNTKQGRRISGASTITMQTMRLIHLAERTYWNKMVEALNSLRLEGGASKKEILEWYLNLAPYGGNVVGIEAAARRYFGKRASLLSAGEGALLAGIPQSPSRFNPVKNLKGALKRREYVLQKMVELGFLKARQVREILCKKIQILDSPQKRTLFPFADYVRTLKKGEGGILRTTLKGSIQRRVEKKIQNRSPLFKRLGIDGIGAVVIHIPRAELVAMVGSLDPKNPLTGFINSTTLKRQPGSLLKPFIYAASFDMGILTPQSVVYDVPTSWQGYRPENMVRNFQGPMTVSRALQESRNLPAVRLLSRIGTNRLVEDGNKLGLQIDGAQERCGLSLALGTAEMRLVDLANGYAALGRLGRYVPLRVFQEEKISSGLQVYSEGASYLTLKALGAGDGLTPRPCWKTGTSWNCRDAWAIALNPEYVVALWCGNYSGKGHPILVGGEAALPLALEILQGLSRGQSWDRPREVRERLVCSLSGAPAGTACEDTIRADYLSGLTSPVSCRIHRWVQKGPSRVGEPHWPPFMSAFWSSQKQGTNKNKKPFLKILSPEQKGEYLLPSSGRASKILQFSARGSSEIEKLYWFLDGHFIGVREGHQTIAWPMKKGHHELVVSDGKGTSEVVKFSVYTQPE